MYEKLHWPPRYTLGNPGVTHYDTLHALSGNEWRVSERVTPGPVTEDGRDIT